MYDIKFGYAIKIVFVVATQIQVLRDTMTKDYDANSIIINSWRYAKQTKHHHNHHMHIGAVLLLPCQESY